MAASLFAVLCVTGCGTPAGMQSVTLSPSPVAVALPRAHESRHKAAKGEGTGPLATKSALAVAISPRPLVDPTQSLKGYADLQTAPYETADTFAVGGDWYTVNLRPGEQLAYVALPKGIAWTIRKDQTATVHQPITAQAIYYSLYQPGGTEAQPTVLLPQTVLAEPADASASVHSSLTLYDWDQGVLYTVLSGNGATRASSLYFAAPGSQPLLLATAREAQPTLSLQATDQGLLYAFGEADEGAIRMGQAGFFNPKTSVTTPLLAPVWPTELYQANASSMTAISGPYAFTIALANAKVTTTSAPPDPYLLRQTAKTPLSTWSTLYLPSATWQDPGSAADTPRCSFGPVDSHAYHLTCMDWHGAGSTVSVTVSRQAVFSAKTSKHADPLQSHANSGAQGVIAPYFGAYITEHTFALSSHEGPVVVWSQAQNSMHQLSWFAAFTSAGWRYEVGPFTSPANRLQTSELMAWLKLFASGSPLPLGSGGQVNIRLLPHKDVYTEVIFSPTSDLSVEATGPGLSPLSALTEWTIAAHFSDKGRTSS